MRSKRTNISNRNLILIIITTAVVAIAVFWFFVLRSDEDTTTNSSNSQKSTTATDNEIVDKYPNRIRLIASGDVVGHDSVNANAKQSDGTYNYFPFIENMAPIFKTADIDFCNQVTPAGGVEFGVKGYPKFNAPTELVRDLGKVGCNTVNMASNHSFDVSQDAINANVEAWDQESNVLAFAGQNRNEAERDSVKYFTVKDVKFALLAYTTYINADAPAQNSYGATQYSRSLAATQIAEAKQNGADVIIASMRWGTEYSDAINAQQQAEAQYLSDQGVSLILGHGPHVLQPVKILTGSEGNKTYVWYSLGNFLNTQLEAEALFNGFAVIDYDKATKIITNARYLPIYMHYEWSAADAAAENLLARKNLKLYLLENTTQDMIDAQQLSTTLDAQKQRINSVLNTYTAIPLIDKATYDK